MKMEDEPQRRALQGKAMEEARKLQEWQNQQMTLQQPAEPQVQATPYEPLPRYQALSPQHYTPPPQQLPWQFPQPQVQQPYMPPPQEQRSRVQRPQVQQLPLEPIPHGYIEEYTDTQEYQPQIQVDSDKEWMYQQEPENQNWRVDQSPPEPVVTTSQIEAAAQEPSTNLRIGPAYLTRAEHQDAITLWNTSEGHSYLQAVDIVRAARQPRLSARLQKQAEAAKPPKSQKDAKTVVRQLSATRDTDTTDDEETSSEEDDKREKGSHQSIKRH